jgi:type III pantothenate kinase
MNLIIDVGNSLVKLAVFKENSLVLQTSFAVNELLNEYKIIRKAYPHLKAGLVSAVGRLPKPHLAKINKDIKLHELSYKSKLPFVNLYETPKTLGVDRMGLASAAIKHYPKKNVLVIDAGTCITYDFINDKGEYLGGAIAPGLRLRYTALNNFTQNLPLLETMQPKTIIGKTTESSIHSGVVFGAVKEIDGVIEHYRTNYQDLTVILTGGDTEFLSNQLKNSIFAHSNFLLEGLNYILDYNSL